jgi:hypothetical protein
MDIYQVSLIVVTPICAGIGYLFKYFLDRRGEYLRKVNETKLRDVEFKLKKFYYPIHSNLLRESIIWNKILAFYRSRNDNNRELRYKLFWELDREMLDIHLENQKIIQDNIVEIHPDDTLTDTLMKYDEHITIYNIIRKVDTERPEDMDNVNWPSTFGSNYPSEIEPLIEKQLKILKEKQNELIYAVV